MMQLVAIGLVAAVLGTAAPQEKPAVSEPATTTPAPANKPAEQDEQGEAKGMVDAIAAIGSIITGAGEKGSEESDAPAAATPAPAAAASPETTVGTDKKAAEPTAAKKPRSAKNSAALITAGAAAGAALGGALGKGSKAAMYGAALGGVAGLIYDRMTYKNPGKI